MRADSTDPSGGGKSLLLPEVTPYVARQISGNSPEDLRTDLEDELRSIAKAIETIYNAVRKLESAP